MIGRWTKVRIGICGAVLAFLGTRVIRQAVQLQVSEAPQLRELAEKNYLREMEVAPRRGHILDRKGDELATTVDFDSVFCNPRQLAAAPDAARRLAKALGMEVREAQRLLGQPKYFAWLRRRVTPEQAAAARALKLPGVGIIKEAGRVYPKAELAATVLGHTSIDGRGLDGVELAYDHMLRGSGLRVAGIRDSYGRALLVDGSIDASASAGQDLVLSLDKYLTFVTERALARAVEKHNAKSGVAVMMDPRTGEVLALANVPTYDPNDPRDAVMRGARNRAITDVFEPGSTMKTFTFAAALNAGKLRPTDMFDCQLGRMTIGKHTIHDDSPKGVISAAEVFKHSSNIGTVKIARRIGKEALYDTLVRFGFGRPTGAGLPGERSGTLHNVSKWGEIEFATHAYGQGLTVTPLQLVTAFAAVASGGIYHPPLLATKVIQPDGREEVLPLPAGARPTERVLSETAARTLLQIMQGVLEKGSTGQLAVIDGYPVAGKTGTAVKVINGHYDYKKYVADFVGIVPADDPRLVIGVMVDEPWPIHHGGEVAAPAFKEIAEEALKYLGVAPTAPLAAKKEGRADRAGKAGVAAVGDEVKEGLGIDLPPAESDELGADEDEAAASDDDARGPRRDDMVTVPSFAGMSVGEAVRAARRAGVELLPEGSGVAIGQMPSPGLKPRGSACRVSFRPGG